MSSHIISNDTQFKKLSNPYKNSTELIYVYPSNQIHVVPFLLFLLCFSSEHSSGWICLLFILFFVSQLSYDVSILCTILHISDFLPCVFLKNTYTAFVLFKNSIRFLYSFIFCCLLALVLYACTYSWVTIHQFSSYFLFIFHHKWRW